MSEICVVGLGAIGTIYAWALQRSGKAKITAVCRSNFRTIADNGLHITSDKLGGINTWRPDRIVNSIADAADRDYDYVICAFKCLPDVAKTPDLISPLLTKTKTFVLIQNGIAIEADLQTAVPDATIISGCAWIDVTAVDGGKTVVQTGQERLTLGYHRPPKTLTNQFDEGAAKESLSVLVDLLQLGGASPEPTDDIDAARWRKILCFSTLCTLSRASVSDILSGKALPDMLPVVRGVMVEVISVARHAGVSTTDLPDNAWDPIIEEAIQDYSDILPGSNPSSFKPSMLVDLEALRPIEVEPIVGGVIKKARELGVSTPR
ncbi:hypothetical protein JAAARDRAFT_218818 [Jaapia argillacea MUCL 33604]|uniref:2-dehydropantoate 2-reductase n=1 Tax=Jaapia argillacea MUCL 33604 TaxID=933084 RepID=A0A067QB45_9AGAM|nr:hypothetical protein JAAARDRAFT_218818 [Jaapia argillacea MUCL 33604]